jgi:hypothetical protein
LVERAADDVDDDRRGRERSTRCSAASTAGVHFTVDPGCVTRPLTRASIDSQRTGLGPAAHIAAAAVTCSTKSCVPAVRGAALERSRLGKTAKSPQ